MGWFSLANVDWVGVAVATLAAFTISYLWYHPRALGWAWARLADVEGRGLVGVTAQRVAVAVITFALTAVVFMVVQAELLIVSMGGGLAFGAFLGVVLRLTWEVLHRSQEGRPIGVGVIDGAHDVLALAVIGAVAGAFL